MSQYTPAYLGWANAERDSSSLRLYAKDLDDSPRWNKAYKGGRVVEYALPPMEGDRYLVIRVGDRFATDAQMAEVADAPVALAEARALLDAWCHAAQDGEPLEPLRAQTLAWLEGR